jgi:hypothetical protein
MDGSLTRSLSRAVSRLLDGKARCDPAQTSAWNEEQDVLLWAFFGFWAKEEKIQVHL